MMCDVILSRLIVTPSDRPDCQDVGCFITARKRSLRQGMVLHLCVVLFTGGVCIPGEGSASGEGRSPLGYYGIR